jgi:hypothetical protein
MFERYTEKARRVIFFARYEASEFGAPYIETEHMLLGLMRENPVLLQLMPDLQPESVRKEIVARSPLREKTRTSVDLPLSNECKRVLAYAAEEAELLASQTIGPGHMLLGLMREEGSFAAKILRDAGTDLSQLRHAVASLPETKPVILHGRPWPPSVIEYRVQECKRFFWKRANFVAPDVVIHRKDGLISFDTSLCSAEPEFELVKGGWKQTECQICTWKFAESEDAARGRGYTNGRDWICTECYEKFLKPASE